MVGTQKYHKTTPCDDPGGRFVWASRRVASIRFRSQQSCHRGIDRFKEGIFERRSYFNWQIHPLVKKHSKLNMDNLRQKNRGKASPQILYQCIIVFRGLISIRWVLWTPLAPFVVEHMWHMSLIRLWRCAWGWLMVGLECFLVSKAFSILLLGRWEFCPKIPRMKDRHTMLEESAIWPGHSGKGEGSKQREGERWSGRETAPRKAPRFVDQTVAVHKYHDAKWLLISYWNSQSQITFAVISAFQKDITVNKSTRHVLLFCCAENHIWVFIKCLIENPAFDSQTKECCGPCRFNSAWNCIYSWSSHIGFSMYITSHHICPQFLLSSTWIRIQVQS